MRKSNLIQHHTLPLKNTIIKSNTTPLHDIPWGDRKNHFSPQIDTTLTNQSNESIRVQLGKPMTSLGFLPEDLLTLDSCISWK